MVLPPEVFSGVSWPLAYPEADVRALERASFLDNLKPREELLEKSSVRMFMGDDSPFTPDDIQALRHMTVRRTAPRQIAASLEAIAEEGEEACKEIVMSGLDLYVAERKTGMSAGFQFRPGLELQKKTVLAVPYE